MNVNMNMFSFSRNIAGCRENLKRTNQPTKCFKNLGGFLTLCLWHSAKGGKILKQGSPSHLLCMQREKESKLTHAMYSLARRRAKIMLNK